MRVMLRVLALLILAFCARSASAGDVQLISDTWDNICKVEVKSGLNAPDQGAAEPYSNVPKNWTITRADKVCYRRNSNPTDCNSGWTDWRCDTELLDQTSVFSLS